LKLMQQPFGAFNYLIHFSVSLNACELNL
jgi:hypothetical protein